MPVGVPSTSHSIGVNPVMAGGGPNSANMMGSGGLARSLSLRTVNRQLVEAISSTVSAFHVFPLRVRQFHRAARLFVWLSECAVSLDRPGAGDLRAKQFQHRGCRVPKGLRRATFSRPQAPAPVALAVSRANDNTARSGQRAISSQPFVSSRLPAGSANSNRHALQESAALDGSARTSRNRPWAKRHARCTWNVRSPCCTFNSSATAGSAKTAALPGAKLPRYPLVLRIGRRAGAGRFLCRWRGR